MSSRVYEEVLYDLPNVAVPDWELCERLEDLLVRCPLPAQDALREALSLTITWTARDERGQYQEPTLADFRRAVEGQEQLPHTITLRRSDIENYVRVQASTSGSGGEVQSQSEAFVHHAATRIRELYAQAAARLPEPVLPEPLPERVSSEPSGLHRFIYDPWTIAIGSALIVAVIIALVVFVF